MAWQGRRCFTTFRDSGSELVLMPDGIPGSVKKGFPVAQRSITWFLDYTQYARLEVALAEDKA